MTTPGKRRQRVQLLSEQPTLLPGQQVAKVLQALGENTYQTLLGDGRKGLYRLPKRLRQVAYIRRGSFVFVRDHAKVRGRITGDIELIVLGTFMSSITKEVFWPERFRAQGSEEREKVKEINSNEEEQEEEWTFGEGNPNRGVWDDLTSSSDGGSTEDDDDTQVEEVETGDRCV
ncbi:unnamed protein product [Agarophyton chilense]